MFIAHVRECPRRKGSRIRQQVTGKLNDAKKDAPGRPLVSLRLILRPGSDAGNQALYPPVGEAEVSPIGGQQLLFFHLRQHAPHGADVQPVRLQRRVKIEPIDETNGAFESVRHLVFTP